MGEALPPVEECDCEGEAVALAEGEAEAVAVIAAESEGTREGVGAALPLPPAEAVAAGVSVGVTVPENEGAGAEAETVLEAVAGATLGEAAIVALVPGEEDAVDDSLGVSVGVVDTLAVAVAVEEAVGSGAEMVTVGEFEGVAATEGETDPLLLTAPALGVELRDAPPEPVGVNVLLLVAVELAVAHCEAEAVALAQAVPRRAEGEGDCEAVAHVLPESVPEPVAPPLGETLLLAHPDASAEALPVELGEAPGLALPPGPPASCPSGCDGE